MTRKPSRATTGSGKAKTYVPDRGDVVVLSLDPQAGSEQAGRRPCLVLSPAAYNGKTGLAVFCPITNQAKGYPFEVPLPAGIKTTGVVLADHVKSLDWRVRRAALVESLPGSVVREVLDTAIALLDPGSEEDEEEASEAE